MRLGLLNNMLNEIWFTANSPPPQNPPATFASYNAENFPKCALYWTGRVQKPTTAGTLHVQSYRSDVFTM